MAINDYWRYFPYATDGVEEVLTTSPTAISGVSFANDQATWNGTGYADYGYYNLSGSPVPNNKSVSFFASKNSSGSQVIAGDSYGAEGIIKALWFDDTYIYLGTYSHLEGRVAHGLGSTFGLHNFIVTWEDTGGGFLVRCYIDNIEKSFVEQPQSTLFSFDILGATDDNESGTNWIQHWDGIFGEFRLYQYTVSASQRAELLANSYPPIPINEVHPNSINLIGTVNDPFIQVNTTPVSVSPTPVTFSIDTYDPIVTAQISELQDDDLDPFNDGSLKQSWTFTNAVSPYSNEQGTNTFGALIPDQALQSIPTDGLLGEYGRTYESYATAKDLTVNGHGIVGDVPCSFSFFSYNGSYAGGQISFGENNQRYNVEFDLSHFDTATGIDFALHKQGFETVIPAPPANAWFSCVYTYANGVNKVYINGVLKVTTSFTMKFLDNGIGFRTFASYPTKGYHGRWDQICVWDKELSQSEVTKVSDTQHGSGTLPDVTITPDIIDMEFAIRQPSIAETVQVDVVGTMLFTPLDIVQVVVPPTIVEVDVQQLDFTVYDPSINGVLFLPDVIPLTATVYDPIVPISTIITVDIVEMNIVQYPVEGTVFDALVTPTVIDLSLNAYDPLQVGDFIKNVDTITLSTYDPTIETFTVVGTLVKSLDIIQEVKDNYVRNNFHIVQKSDTLKVSKIITRGRY